MKAGRITTPASPAPKVALKRRRIPFSWVVKISPANRRQRSLQKRNLGKGIQMDAVRVPLSADYFLQVAARRCSNHNGLEASLQLTSTASAVVGSRFS